MFYIKKDLVSDLEVRRDEEERGKRGGSVNN